MIQSIKDILAYPGVTRRVSQSKTADYLFRKGVGAVGVKSMMTEMRAEREELTFRLEKRLSHQISPDSFQIISQKLARQIYTHIKEEKKGSKSSWIVLTAKCLPDDAFKELVEDYVELVFYQILGGIALEVDSHKDNSHLVTDLFQNIVDVLREEMFGTEETMGFLDKIEELRDHSHKEVYKKKEILEIFKPFLSRIFAMLGYHEPDNLPLPRFCALCWDRIFYLISRRLFYFFLHLRDCEMGERKDAWDLSGFPEEEALAWQCDQLSQKIFNCRGTLFDVFFAQNKVARKFRKLFSTDEARSGYDLEEFLADGVSQCLHHVAELDETDPICKKIQFDLEWIVKFVCRQFLTSCPKGSDPLFVSQVISKLTQDVVETNYFGHIIRNRVTSESTFSVTTIDERLQYYSHLSNLIIEFIYPNGSDDMPVWFSDQEGDFKIFKEQFPVFVKDIVEEVSLPEKRNRNFARILRKVNSQLSRTLSVVSSSKPNIMKGLTIGQSKKVLEQEISETIDLIVRTVWMKKIQAFQNFRIQMISAYCGQTVAQIFEFILEIMRDVMTIIFLLPLWISFSLWNFSKKSLSRSMVEIISMPEHERLVLRQLINLIHTLSVPLPDRSEDEIREDFRRSLNQILEDVTDATGQNLWMAAADYGSKKVARWCDREINGFLRGDDLSKGGVLRSLEIFTQILERLVPCHS
ncbi:MAG: hypothetical protein K940chlam3_01638 [Chlamydiae bacterium]|nr:hypothetical protein [Chlamydiota bacterium]